MAVETFLEIVSEDAQGYQDTLSFRIAPLAFAAAQTVPTAAEIDAVIDAIFGTTGVPSTQRVVSYSVRIQQDAPASTGGNGEAPTSEAIRVRNELTGIPGNWLFRIPGLNKAAVLFDPTNPNSISTTGAMWDAVRAALAAAHIAVADPTGGYSATPEDEIAQVATVFDGRRAPLRPR
jgi:hypothetical protein